MQDLTSHVTRWLERVLCHRVGRGGGDHDICDVSQQYNSSKHSFMIYLVSAKNLWVYPHVCFRVGIFWEFLVVASKNVFLIR